MEKLLRDDVTFSLPREGIAGAGSRTALVVGPKFVPLNAPAVLLKWYTILC